MDGEMDDSYSVSRRGVLLNALGATDEPLNGAKSQAVKFDRRKV
jgi:hypothetical protein